MTLRGLHRLRDALSRWLLLKPLLVLLALAATASAAAAGPTLDGVRARGHLLCGVPNGMPGFAAANERGQWSGLAVEYCQAVAVATLGSKDALKVIPLSESERYQALTSGSVDILIPSSAWTLSRDTELGIVFTDVLFHDGQGFLVHRGDAVTSVLELSGSTVCALTGTTAEQGVSDFFKSRQMKYQLVVSERWSELVKAYENGGCTLLTADLSLLALERSRFQNPTGHLLLPELITKEPLAPAVREGDDQWFRIARWTLSALIAAEEQGLTSASVEAARSSQISETRRLLSLDQGFGQGLGLAEDWAYQVVRQVGSYGEIFERTIGVKSPMRLERGINAIWSKGGLMYAAPFR